MYLRGFGANLEALNSCGWRPRHVAAAKGQLGIVKALLDHGANTEVMDDTEKTPLYLAPGIHQNKAVRSVKGI